MYKVPEDTSSVKRKMKASKNNSDATEQATQSMKRDGTVCATAEKYIPDWPSLKDR
jgi:hypothetical protein